MTGTLHEDRYTLLIKRRSFPFRIKNVSKKSCRESQNTHFLFSNDFFGNLAVYEIMCRNIVALGRPQTTIWRMSIPCWVRKSTNTHSEYVISIAFPL